MNPLFGNIGGFAGLKIVTDDVVMSEHDGWSFDLCRSPARARRRHKRRGFPISKMVREIRTPKPDVYQVGDTLIMHSSTLRKLEAEMLRRNRESGPRGSAPNFMRGF